MKLLIIEDEKILAESMAAHLGKFGFVTETVFSYDDAIEKIHLYFYDCVIVDINLPDGLGFDIVQALRQLKTTCGIIVVSARNALDDKIKSLEIGADDYLTKPFHISELTARVKSILRRMHFDGKNEILFNEIKVEFNSRKVQVNQSDVVLSKKEFDLLVFFLSNVNMALTRSAIAEHLWGDNIDSSDSFDILYSHIKNLRKKLADKGCRDYINSIYGIGYKFNET